jgi:hypothetical protein
MSEFTAEITSECVCIKYDEFGEPVLDKNGDTIPADQCNYDCYTEQVFDFTETFLPMWLESKAIMADSPVRIGGSGMTWRGVGGYTDTSARGIVKALEFGNQFTLYFTLKDGDLSCVRRSHDEYGALFEIEPMPIADDDTEWR